MKKLQFIYSFGYIFYKLTYNSISEINIVDLYNPLEILKRETVVEGRFIINTDVLKSII